MFETPDNQPLIGFHFSVNFLFPAPLGAVETKFREIQGIEHSINLVPASDSLTTAKYQGPNENQFGTLVLVRGMIKSSNLITWISQSGSMLKKLPIPICINVLDHNHAPVYSYFFFDAFPVKFVTRGFDAMKSEYLVEEIHLKYSKFTQNAYLGSMLSNFM